MADTEEELRQVRIKLIEMEQKARDTENMLMQAAQYGKDLLEKNIELESNNENLQQEKYEINLKLQAKLNIEKNLSLEVEHLREAVKTFEHKLENRDVEDDEKWSKREEIWKAKISESDVALQAAENKVQLLSERLEVTEKQLQEASEAMNQSVGGQSLSAEFAELHSQNVDLIKDKNNLELELSKAKTEIQESNSKVMSSSARIELLQRELEEAECNMSSYSRAADNAKTEMMELQAQLDAIQLNNVNEDGKGNSLFSEVNDRREKVETQLKVYEERYDLLKSNFDVKMAELQKTKMHNAKLLSIAGNSYSDNGQVSRLEELLSTERNKNKTLRERLDTLEKLSLSNEAVAPVTQSHALTQAQDDTTVVIPHTLSDEYTYLSTLLTNTQTSNMELKKQLQEQFRLSLEDSDKLRDMTRKVNQLESSLQKLKAENYTLKINIDELKCKKGDQKIAKKEQTMIHEKIVFEKKPRVVENESDVFVLKETVGGKSSNNVTAAKTQISTNTAPSPEKENIIDKPRKKVASFAENVEKISTEGDKESSMLQSQSPKEKVKTSKKPQGKKKFGAANTVFVSDKDNAQQECNQQ